ncbi:hypothetical protein M0813_22778 [Anaeramoeba flamelloides]|uniref:Uncharacterized protein n=1 Tax=Anaeramoeba flamelloides TaxID=1746091 RepID=A0ABQ8YCH2_9EUKA|nr:hypothetical protein M0813_22778 [Anaeramoeba flamelloides]
MVCKYLVINDEQCIVNRELDGKKLLDENKDFTLLTGCGRRPERRRKSRSDNQVLLCLFLKYRVEKEKKVVEAEPFEEKLIYHNFNRIFIQSLVRTRNNAILSSFDKNI